MNNPTYIQEAVERLKTKYPRIFIEGDRGFKDVTDSFAADITSELQGLGERIIEKTERMHNDHYARWEPTEEQMGYRRAQMDIVTLIRSLTSPDSSKE